MKQKTIYIVMSVSETDGRPITYGAFLSETKAEELRKKLSQNGTDAYVHETVLN